LAESCDEHALHGETGRDPLDERGY
jgi:hypothetical protein